MILRVGQDGIAQCGLGSTDTARAVEDAHGGKQQRGRGAQGRPSSALTCARSRAQACIKVSMHTQRLSTSNRPRRGTRASARAPGHRCAGSRPLLRSAVLRIGPRCVIARSCPALDPPATPCSYYMSLVWQTFGPIVLLGLWCIRNPEAPNLVQSRSDKAPEQLRAGRAAVGPSIGFETYPPYCPPPRASGGIAPQMLKHHCQAWFRGVSNAWAG